MEFLPKSTNSVPKNLYPCLAIITVTPPTQLTRVKSNPTNQDNDDGNVLTRVISGRRRKSSFGTGTDAATTTSGAGTTNNTTTNNEDPTGKMVDSGKWYWRVQAGVTDTHLVLLPLSTPPNPLLTSAPAPLSEAMPFHSVNHDRAVGDEAPEDRSEHTGLIDKLKHTFHIGQSKQERRLSQGEPTTQAPATTAATGPAPGADKIIDQTASGDHVGIPNKEEPNVEHSWPGVVGGERLASIVIPLQSIEKGKVTLGGGKKGEASWVTVQVISHFQTLAHSMLESVGAKHHESWGKSGTIRFEFDKEWIGAKAEAELLHHFITTGLENPAPPFDTAPEDNIHAVPDPTSRHTFFPESMKLRHSESIEAYESLRQPLASRTRGEDELVAPDSHTTSTATAEENAKVPGA